MKPHIRWMIRRDMPEVLAIEEDSYAAPWTEDDFIRCLRQRNCIGMVAIDRESERVLGFMVYELHKSRLHLLNIAVSRDDRRRGIGRAMVEKLVGKLSSQRRNRLALECADWNLDGHLFFRACGMRAVGVMRDFYNHDEGDAYSFVLDIPRQQKVTA